MVGGGQHEWSYQYARHTVNRYTQIAFRDAEKSKYSGTSGIAYYMLCNPDGSIFIDNKYEVSPNLYDLAHTYQSGGWYWFNMTGATTERVYQNGRYVNMTVPINKYYNFQSSFPYYDYRRQEELANYNTQQNAYSWSAGNGFNAMGGYIQVVDNAGNISKKIITQVPAYSSTKYRID